MSPLLPPKEIKDDAKQYKMVRKYFIYQLLKPPDSLIRRLSMGIRKEGNSSRLYHG